MLYFIHRIKRKKKEIKKKERKRKGLTAMMKLKLRTDNKALMNYAIGIISSFYNCAIELGPIKNNASYIEANIHCLPEFNNIVRQNLDQFIVKENS